jgi:quercetin dioxygenase-like cupin family protein
MPEIGSGQRRIVRISAQLPKGYQIPAHTHPKPEIVTIISGTFFLASGEKLDRASAKALPAGSFFVMSQRVQ